MTLAGQAMVKTRLLPQWLQADGTDGDSSLECLPTSCPKQRRVPCREAPAAVSVEGAGTAALQPEARQRLRASSSRRMVDLPPRRGHKRSRRRICCLLSAVCRRPSVQRATQLLFEAASLARCNVPASERASSVQLRRSSHGNSSSTTATGPSFAAAPHGSLASLSEPAGRLFSTEAVVTRGHFRATFVHSPFFRPAQGLNLFTDAVALFRPRTPSRTVLTPVAPNILPSSLAVSRAAH
ncbi:hypothetical protein PSPO01_05534 [Paraphaeosphaeria sporulosa]